MFQRWRRPEDQDRDLKEAAQRETERVKAAVRLLELSIERAAHRSIEDLERDLRTKYASMTSRERE